MIKHNFLILSSVTWLVLSGCSSSSGDSPAHAGQIPVSPSNVTAFPGDKAITLQWENAPNTAYKIYMASQAQVKKSGLAADDTTILTDFMVHPSVPNPFRHVNLTNGTTYYFAVVAVNTEGKESVLSTEVFATPTGQLLPPSNLTSSLATSKKVNLSWQDNSSLEFGYVIERAEQFPDNVLGNWLELAKTARDITQYSDTKVTAGKTYQYRVYAFTDIEITDFSNTISIYAPIPDANKFLQFTNSSAPRFKENDQTAQAYYAAIDPTNSKTTFTAWKNINGFGSGTNPAADTPAIYFNDTDLGFGRRMHVINQVNGGVASYVQNYPTLDDAINDTNLLVTVAMEYTQAEVSQITAEKKQVVIGQSRIDLTPSAILSQTLPVGAYRVIAARDFSDSNSKAPFSLTITYSDGTPTTIYQDKWVSEWNSLDNTYRLSDPSNPTFLFEVASEQLVTIELGSDLDDYIILQKSSGKIIAEDDNSGGGTTAKISMPNLPPGEYNVILTASNRYTQASMSTLNVTGINRLYVQKTVELKPMGFNDPDTPAYTGRVSFIVQATDDITITFSSDSGPADPYLYFVGSGGTGQHIYQQFSSISQVIIPGQNTLTLDLPKGTYTAVAGTSVANQQAPFSLQLFDENSAELAFDDTSIVKSWNNSGGATPYSIENPHFPFTVNPPGNATSQKITLRLGVDPSIRAFYPSLYVLGDMGKYRHIEAANTGKPKSINPEKEALIETVLAIGTYTVVAATQTPAYTGDYQLDITANQSTSLLSFSGTWTNSSGPAFQGTGNPREQFVIDQNNSAVKIRLRHTGEVQPVLYLLDSAGKVINQNTYPDLTKSFIDTQLLPGNYFFVAATETTYGKSADFTLDVSIDGVAQPQTIGAWRSSDKNNPYSPTNPRIPLTLTKNSHITASLASRVPVSLYIISEGDQKITTFYTFAADGSRVSQVDLDGRGLKSQPGVCVPCHGGAPKTLVNGNYPDHGDTGASFIAWDLDLFKYSSTNANYSRSALEPKLKDFNKTVLALRLMPASDTNENYEPARNTVIKGWYGGPELPWGEFDGSFIPKLWIPDSKSGLTNNIPDGADELYLKVVKPTCRVCHLQKGGLLDAKSDNPEMALAFGTYAGFIGYQEEIEQAIYDKSTMPMARRTFDKFWQAGQAEKLATLLPGFSHYKDPATSSEILKPGRPIASAGASLLSSNRLVAIGDTTTLSANASVFADNYLWKIVSAPGSNSVLSSADTAIPTFTPDTAGEYTFELTVSNDEGQSTSQITLSADTTTNVIPVSFSNDIKPIFDPNLLPSYQTGPLHHCMNCHVKRDNKYNIVYGEYFSRLDHEDGQYTVDFSSNDVYTMVRDRIDIDDPGHSPMLEKPSNPLQHGGGKESGYQSGANEPNQYYDLMLRWILEGAKNN